jgi:hypothetical protein
MSLLFPAPAGADPVGAPRSWCACLAQGEWWKSADGWVRIANMTPAHRANAARRTLVKVEHILLQVEWEEMRILTDAPDEVWDSFENEWERRSADPRAWLRSTALYQALTVGTRFDGAVDDDH